MSFISGSIVIMPLITLLSPPVRGSVYKFYDSLLHLRKDKRACQIWRNGEITSHNIYWNPIGFSSNGRPPHFAFHFLT